MTTVAVAGDGVALLYCAIILLVLTWVVFGMRLGVRVWRKAWGMDDYMMAIGIVSARYYTQEHELTWHSGSLLCYGRPLHSLLLLWIRTNIQ
jgi:hypothetical protein